MKPRLQHLLPVLLLAACDPGLGDQSAELVIRVYDHDAPAAGLKILALDDDSNRLGEGVVGVDAVARVPVSRAGPLWLAANAGQGRGVVTRVTAQPGGATDVGERAVALLDEQPSVFRLKGIGYEERLTEFDGLRDFVVLEDANLIVASVFRRSTGGGWALSHDLVAVDLSNGVSETICTVDSVYDLDVRLHFPIEDRYALATVKGPGARLFVYDGQRRRLVLDLPLDEHVEISDWTPDRTWKAPAIIDEGSIIYPHWRNISAAPELVIARASMETGEIDETVVWSHQALGGPEAHVQPEDMVISSERLLASARVSLPCPSAECSDEWQYAVFDVQTSERISVFRMGWKPDVVTSNVEVFDVRNYLGGAEVIRVDPETGQTGVVATVTEKQGYVTMTSCENPRGESLLLIWSGRQRITSGPLMAIIQVRGSEIETLPLTGLPENSVHHCAYVGEEPSLMTIEGHAERGTPSLWRFDGVSWVERWRGEPGGPIGYLQYDRRAPVIVAADPNSSHSQFYVDRGAGLPEVRTWARRDRREFSLPYITPPQDMGPVVQTSRDGSVLWYLMNDPLSGTRQVFRVVSPEVTQ